MKKLVLILVLVIFCLSCGFPNEKKVMEDFNSANPNLTPISAIFGEGHSDAAYFHIRYKKLNDDKTYEQIWLYLRQTDGNFKITNKEKETIVE